MGVKPNPPHRHHYIPAFYLSRWATGQDGKLCQFSIYRTPARKIVPNRRFPTQTGFMDRLYAIEGLPEEVAHVVEQDFFSPADSHAADALALLEAEGGAAKWDTRRRSGWSRFLHSLLMRCPEDLAVFKHEWRETMLLSDEDFEARYQAAREEHDAPTWKEHVESLAQEEMEISAMRTLIKLIDGKGVGEKMNALTWAVIDTTGAEHELLTSDRPIIRTNGLMAENGHLALPIGPRKLFLAAKDPETVNRISSIPAAELVTEANRQVVEFAVRFVYGTDDRQLRFVKNRMATKEQPRIVSGLNKRGREHLLKQVAD